MLLLLRAHHFFWGCQKKKVGSLLKLGLELNKNSRISSGFNIKIRFWRCRD
jgi:hypothetical protein